MSQIQPGLYTNTTLAFNWDAAKRQYKLLANGDNTLTFSGPISGGDYILILKQPASGAAGTVTWPATVAWDADTAPTLTVTNNKVDVIQFYYEGVNTKYRGKMIMTNQS